MPGELKALVLDCTLKKSPAPSSSMLLAEQVVEAFGSFDVRETSCGWSTTTCASG